MAASWMRRFAGAAAYSMSSLILSTACERGKERREEEEHSARSHARLWVGLSVSSSRLVGVSFLVCSLGYCALGIFSLGGDKKKGGKGRGRRLCYPPHARVQNSGSSWRSNTGGDRKLCLLRLAPLCKRSATADKGGRKEGGRKKGRGGKSLYPLGKSAKKEKGTADRRLTFFPS